MKKRFIWTIIAFVIFFILLVYVNVHEVEDIPEPGQDLPVELAKIPLAEVKGIAWKNFFEGPKRGEADTEVKAEVKNDGSGRRFEIVKPRSFRGETSEFEGLLRNFEDLKSIRVINKNATDSATYGISTSSARLEIETASRTFAFVMGSQSPIDGMLYFQRQEDPAIYLVSSPLGSAFNKTVNDLRSKTFFFEDFATVASLTLETSSGTIKLEKNKNQDWMIMEPREMLADAGEVSGIIFGAHDLRVSRFVADEAPATAPYGFEKPTRKVTLVDNKGKTYVLLTGKEDGGEVYVKRQDQPYVYALAKSNLAVLDKDFNRIRSRELPKITRTDTKKMLLKLATDTFTVDLSSSTWLVNGKAVDSKKVTALIDAYNIDRVTSFLPWDQKEKENLSALERNDRFEIHSASESRVVYFGKGDGGDISIVLNGKEEIYKVPIHLYDTFKSLFDEIKQAQKPEKPLEGTASPSKIFPPPISTETQRTIEELKKTAVSSTPAPINPPVKLPPATATDTKK